MARHTVRFDNRFPLNHACPARGLVHITHFSRDVVTGYLTLLRACDREIDWNFENGASGVIPII